MSLDVNIPDVNSYNIEMRKSMIDKIFFMDKFDADIYVDYGCADGQLIKFLNNIFPEKMYIGFDISETELALARTNNPTIKFYSEWDKLMEFVSQTGKKIAVICNSVIHEIYHYSNTVEVEEFWNRIFDPVFDYVVIRDMCVSRSATRQSDSLSVIKIRQRFSLEKINEFETYWGSLNENWSLVHFLLKYRYEKNWTREVRENYLPVNYEDLLAKILPALNPVFIEHFTLPFIRQQVKKDFNLELQDRTHIKLILERVR